MLKIKPTYSTRISIILSILFFLGCIVGIFFMPHLVDTFISITETVSNRSAITSGGKILIFIFSYAVLFDLMLADNFLFLLLKRVQKSLVFTKKSIALIRGVAWCCLALGGFFGLLGIYFRLSLVPAFAAVFLGLCLRVVKNVIEQATEIKSENDLTV